jgi:hypothetical protein
MDKEIQDMLNDLPNKKFSKLSDNQLISIENIINLSKSDEWRKKTSETHKGKKRSKETIKKLSEKKFSEEHRKNISISRGKIVYCYSYPDMKLLQEYHSTAIAAKELNLEQSCVALTCVGKRKSTGGYTFRYK